MEIGTEIVLKKWRLLKRQQISNLNNSYRSLIAVAFCLKAGAVCLLGRACTYWRAALGRMAMKRYILRAASTWESACSTSYVYNFLFLVDVVFSVFDMFLELNSVTRIIIRFFFVLFTWSLSFLIVVILSNPVPSFFSTSFSVTHFFNWSVKIAALTQ